jgi:HSP20 family protein
MLNTAFTTDVRRTLDQFRRSVDQLFDNFYGYPSDRGPANQSEATQWTFSPMIESGWDDNALHLRTIVPGVRQGDLNVSLEGNQLVISGERKAPETFKKNAFTQLSYGKFWTSVALPNGLDAEKVNCELHDGVLDIYIPIAETMKPKQIPVHGAGQQKSIGA